MDPTTAHTAVPGTLSGPLTEKQEEGVSRRDSLLLVAALCLGGIAVNLLMIPLRDALHMAPLLPTLGTILAALCGGYLPAILTGFLTSVAAVVYDSSYAYYGSISVLVAFYAVYFNGRGWLSRFPRALFCIVGLAALDGGGGTLLSWLLNGMKADPVFSTAPSAALMASLGIDEVYAQLIVNVLESLVDKTISVIAVFLALRLIPGHILRLMHIYGWQQAPLRPEAQAAARQRYSRTMSLRSKILLLLAAALILVAAAAMSIGFLLFSRTTLSDSLKQAEGIAGMAAAFIDGDRVGDFLAEGEDAEGYRETEARLQQVWGSSERITYIYVYKILPDGCHVVFDLDTPELEGAAPGDVIEFDESFAPYLPLLLNGQPIEPIISDDTYGWLLTVYHPVYDSAGVCQCYAAADISMELLRTTEFTFFAKMVSLFLGFFVLVLSAGLWLAEYNITLPINTMAMAAGTFAYDSESARSGSIDRIRELEIRTGDEIENLYVAFEKTTEDTVRYISDVQEKSDEISKLQRGLILVLADIIESRDHCTGDHIRKTAEYTRIILEQMRREGIYADRLSDQFVEDVVNSAPLHDIGKIQVPDAILNKPDKLTDEEFRQMKSHTTAGSEIISRAIAIVPEDSGYLEEAKNLAACHHERWDGKGYPNGLAGEDIPLSARVMAVADVFDALVSRRSYKTPFSVDSALDLIRRESGTHFDPNIVTAFLHAEEKVRRAAATHMELAGS